MPVHELGLDQHGKVYFTMRLVKGRTAREVFVESHGGTLRVESVVADGDGWIVRAGTWERRAANVVLALGSKAVFVWVAVFDDATVFQHQHAVAECTHGIEIVRDEHQREATRPLQFAQQIEDPGLHRQIERGYGFVADQHLGVQRQRTGNRDPLLLPTRQVARQGIAQGLQVELFGARGLWALRIPFEHMGARIFPDMFSLAMAHKAFTEQGALVDTALQGRLEKTVEAFLTLVEATTHYPCMKRAWVEFLGEPVGAGLDRVDETTVA